MGSRYKIRDQEGLYFVTFTVIGWLDVFIREVYRECLIDSFKYCIKNKGFKLHAFVIMSSHLHAIVSADDGFNLTSIIKEYKRHTSKEIIKLIKSVPESRREWMLNKFSYEAQRKSRGKDYIFWQEGYHAKQIETNDFLDQKLGYIHNNPVAAGIVDKPEDYIYSSARNYADEQGMLDLEMLY